MSFQAFCTDTAARFLSQGRNIPVQFDQIRLADLEGYQSGSGIFVAPYTGTYAFSVDFKINGTSLVSSCEIIVENVDTPITLNENKTIGRIVLTLDKGKRVWVEFKGEYTDPISTVSRHFSGCLLHRSA